MRSDSAAGTSFPVCELPGHTGKPRRLSAIQAGDPMIIVLAREAYSAAWQRDEIHRFYAPELGWPPDGGARGASAR